MIKRLIRPKGDPLSAIDSARDKIAKLKAERTKIEEASKSRESVEAAIAEGLDHFANKAGSAFAVGHLTPPYGDGVFRPNFDTIDLAAIVIALNREKIEELIAADLDKLYADDAGISEGERAQRLKKIDAELLVVERAEELAIRDAEAGGYDILRRGDADPRAVLAK